MPLDLELLPDKPKTLQAKLTKLGIDLDLLPDKPTKQKISPLSMIFGPKAAAAQKIAIGKTSPTSIGREALLLSSRLLTPIPAGLTEAIKVGKKKGIAPAVKAGLKTAGKAFISPLEFPAPELTLTEEIVPIQPFEQREYGKLGWLGNVPRAVVSSMLQVLGGQALNQVIRVATTRPLNAKEIEGITEAYGKELAKMPENIRQNVMPTGKLARVLLGREQRVARPWVSKALGLKPFQAPEPSIKLGAIKPEVTPKIHPSELMVRKANEAVRAKLGLPLAQQGEQLSTPTEGKVKTKIFNVIPDKTQGTWVETNVEPTKENIAKFRDFIKPALPTIVNQFGKIRQPNQPIVWGEKLPNGNWNWKITFMGGKPLKVGLESGEFLDKEFRVSLLKILPKQLPTPTEGKVVKEPKVVPAPKGKITILPQKEQLLTQIQEAINKAPTYDEVYTIAKQKAGIEATENDIKAQLPKVTFQIDGGANIINAKESLTKFYDIINKTTSEMEQVVKPPKVSISKPIAGKKEDIDKLIKLPTKEYFTDGKLIIKGIPPKTAKFSETREITNINQITDILQTPTKSAQFLYYGIKHPEVHGVSIKPVPQVEEVVPKAIFQSEGKYFQYNQFKFNAIRNRFPNASYGISDKGALVAYINKEPVAVLMPMQPSIGAEPFRKQLLLAKEAKQAGIYKPEPQRPPKPTGEAFAIPEGGLEEWIKRQEEQQGIKLKKVETPELVKLAVELQGKYPIVKKLATSLGLFKFGKGIALNVEIFKNPKLTGMVLAHEIGHLMDWLPDFIIKRGNLLGRIATLKMYMKSLLPEKPGMEATMLTDKDRARLKREAETLLKEEAKRGEYEIIEEIIKEIPIYANIKITPETILSLWKEAATSMRVTHPDLYNFIAGLSGKEKNAVIKQALRGIIDERIAQMYGGGKVVGKKIIKEQVKRTITPVEITPENIRKRFKELLEQEIKKRKLFKNEVIKEELKRTTQWWNPFDDTRKDWFTNYRYSSKELYAEAISVLLNAPEKLEEIAPNFYKAFFNYIDRKPEVKQALLELQDFLALGEGEKLRIRSQDIRNMFKKGEELFYEKRTQYQAQQKSLWFRLKTELIDKNTAILNKLKESEKQGKKINPEDNPKYYLEEWNYIGGKIKNLLDKVNTDIITPLINQGITQEDLGEYLFLNRVVTERKDIANPLGQNRETAQKQLDYLSETLGQEKFNLLKISADKFQNILKNLLNEAQEIGFYKPEAFAEIITNPAYATFQVLDYLDDYVTPAIIHQIGTLKPIANPLVSTTLKMISLKRAIEKIKTNNSIINFMQTNFPNEIISAKVHRFGKYKSEIVEKEGYGIIKTRRNGNLVGYYVDPYIADSVNYQPSSRSNAVISIFRFLNSSYFRPVYVNLNLGFQTFNLMRDFVRAWKLNPDVNFPQMLKKYTEAIPIARQRIWGNFTNPVIIQMQQSGMLSFTYNNLMRGVEDEETQIEFLMKQYDILKKNPQNPAMKVLNFIEEIGDFIETLPKVTGYLARVKSSRNIKEIAHEVRVFSGSPDFLRKGTGYDWYNNIFLFSNAMKEGFRGDYEGAFRNPRTRSGYWWRTAKLNLLPKILMFLGALGFFGKKIKDNYDKQTEFDKTNYTTIPLGETEDNKAIYLRIPNDEVGRLLSGILWKILNFKKSDILSSIQQVTSLTAGQLPSLAPEIEMFSAIIQYAVGQNPYDFFRGRTILTDDEREASGWYSLKPMIRWIGGKAGIYGVTIRAKKDDQTPFEKFIQWTPIVQRYLRITAYGEEEIKREEKSGIEKRRAIIRLKRKE